ncbi:MAG TPA: tyrosine--tRNA ligase, partial [Ruminococcaceae bacterium]|nr:tyrosine--tRNA ligase [Oscillospiraceae bacterium]
NVIRLLKMLTFLPLEEIEQYSTLEGSKLNKAKEILAYELTKQVHGEEAAIKAREAAKALFGSGNNHENMPSTELSQTDLQDGQITILELLVKCGLASSRGEGRRLVEQGGVRVNDVKVSSFSKTFSANVLAKGFILKKGKKVYHKVSLK